MARRGKRSCRHLNNQISRSQVLAHLVQSQVDQLTLPCAVVNAQPPEPDHFDNEQDFTYDEGPIGLANKVCDSVSSSSLDDGLSTHDNRPSSESYTAEQQIHYMFGDNLTHSPKNTVVEPDDMQLDEQPIEPAPSELDHGVDDMIKIDAHEQAMLDLLLLCQEAGTSLKFFDNLVNTLHCMERKF